VIDNDRRARLRIDRASSGASAFIGELKVIATQAAGAGGELPAESIVVRQWDGKQLTFEAAGGAGRQRFVGSVSGRTIGGTVLEGGVAPPRSFTGTRADILGYGLRELSADARLGWQARTRGALLRLMMAGNPAPIATRVATTARPLFQSSEVDPARDDDVKHWPQNYELSDVELDHMLPNPYGGASVTRHSHGLLAIPTTPPPPDGYPLALSLNGHGGSAVRQFEPNDAIFWYADAFARRGYIVLALDMSHRPPSDTGGLYDDIANGDDPANGNEAHPAIAAPGMDSDWTEDGERAWDAMRGIDFLLTQPDANAGRIAVTGLSMGGEVTEIVAALDPRVSIVVPAGAPPDLSLMGPHGNHPCWRWTNGDATEFIDMSDYLSLLAPRAVILETGKFDNTYSSYATPYAVEKENAWRARIAFGSDSANFAHDLHDGAHQYRVSDISDEDPDPSFIQVPQVIAPPGVRKRSPAWEVNGETSSLDETLFDYLSR
jgi:dienelactone hydrolase